MSFLCLCTILLAALSCSARPNMPPGFLVGNAERSFTPRRIDIVKYLQDIQEAVSKAAKDASENVKQHIADMKQKNMEMVRHHFLQKLAPNPYTNERLDGLNRFWNVPPSIVPCPDCLPIKHNISAPYQSSYPSQIKQSPCRGSISTCFQAFDLSLNRPTGTYVASRPCSDEMCNNTHEKPHQIKPLYPKPHYPNDSVTVPSVINSYESFSSEKNSSNNIFEFSKPVHHISTTIQPVFHEVTKTPSFQITLSEKLFNLATNPTTQTIVKPTETLEDLRENASILENEILQIETIELNKQLKESLSNLPPKGKLAEHETTVPEFTTLSTNELEITTSNNYDEHTTLKIWSDLNTLTVPEEEQKTESIKIKVNRERLDAFMMSPSNKNQQIKKVVSGGYEATLPTIYKGNSIKKVTLQDQSTEKTNEWDTTENTLWLKTTGEPLLVTEKSVGYDATYQETTFKPLKPAVDKTSATPSINERITVTTDDISDKTFQEKKTTDHTNLDPHITTVETHGAEALYNVTKKLSLNSHEDTDYTEQTVTTIHEDYNTSKLKTGESLYKNNVVTHEIPETTTLEQTTINDDFTTELEVVTAFGDTKNYNSVTIELFTEIPDSVTKISKKSNQIFIDDAEKVTMTREILEVKSDLGTTVLSVESTTQAVKNVIFLDYEYETEKGDDLFETTTKSIAHVKNSRENNYYTTTDVTDYSQVASPESTIIISKGSQITTQEEGVIEYDIINNTSKISSSKIDIENQKQPFGVLEERSSNNKTSAPEFLTATEIETLTTTPTTVTDDEKLKLENFETTTNFEDYFEISTQPLGKRLDEVDTTDIVQVYKTESVINEEQLTDLNTSQSTVLGGESTRYQEGVLKFTTELDSETEASPTDNFNNLPSYSAILPNTIINLRDAVRGRLPFSPMQAVKQCKDFADCLLKNRIKRSLPDNIKSLSRRNNVPPLNNTHSPDFLNSSYLSKKKLSSAEQSSLYGLPLLELLVMREGYRNNAFNENDKETFRSMLANLGRQTIEANIDNLKKVKGDFLTKVTATVEERTEDKDYNSSEYGDMSLEIEHWSKRSKKSDHLMLSKTLNDQVKTLKLSSQRYGREIRSSQSLSEAAAILALLAEKSEVQPDYMAEDNYEYYEDEGSHDVALDQESYEDYEEPSFVELIKLARARVKLNSRQEP